MKKCMSLVFFVMTWLLLGACRSENNPIAVSPEPSTGLNRILSMSEYYLLPGSVTVLYPRKMDVRLVSESPSPKVSAADPAIAQAIQSILDTYRVEEATAEETYRSWCREEDGSLGSVETSRPTFTHVYQFPIQAQRQEILAAFRALGLSAYATTAPWGKASFPEPISAGSWRPLCSAVLYTLIPEVVSE